MDIHYFQRYHEKENVDTANLMLLFSRLYVNDSTRFFNFLNDLLNIELEDIKFELQTKGVHSVPDAAICQPSFKILIETKLYNQFSVEQLKNHVKGFDNEDFKILLTVDPQRMNENTNMLFKQELDKINENITGAKINHVNTTFEEIISLVDANIDKNDSEMVNIMNDFKQYCFEENLIDRSNVWMRGIAAGTTIQSNITYRMYYDGFQKGFSKHGYIGLYTNKAIRAVGKLEKIAVGYTNEQGEYIIELEQGSELTDEERNRIRDMVNESTKYYSDALIKYKHRFFLVDKFVRTEYKKTSKGGIQRAKFFDLGKIFGTDNLPNTEEIAARLNNHDWEENTTL